MDPRFRRNGNGREAKKGMVSFEARMRQSARNAVRLLRAERERRKWQGRRERGIQREDYTRTLLKNLEEAGDIIAMTSAEQHSWMDFVLKVDSAAQRRDGIWVPIQVKATEEEKQNFLLQKGDLCAQMYGAPPIVMVVSPDREFPSPQRRARRLLRKINKWNGTGSDFRLWMIQADEAFRPWSSNGGFGRAGQRIREFVCRHPDYFSEPGLRCGLFVDSKEEFFGEDNNILC